MKDFLLTDSHVSDEEFFAHFSEHNIGHGKDEQMDVQVWARGRANKRANIHKSEKFEQI